MFGRGGGTKRRIGRAVTGLVLTGATSVVGGGHHAEHDPMDIAREVRAESSPSVTASPSHSAKPSPAPSHTAKPAPSASRTHVARPHKHQAKRAANLQISKSVTPDPMIIGQEATYTVIVTNTGDEAAEDVTVHDNLDANVTAGALPAGCSGRQTITCGGKGTTIPAGGSLSYQIPVTVDPGVPDGTNITNKADAVAPGVPTANTQLISQTRTLTDVEITKSGPAEVGPDGMIQYTITVTNHGPSDAVDVTVQDETNGNLTTIVERPEQCPGDTGLTMSCSLGTLKPGETQTLTLVLKVNSGVEPGTEIPNCAKVYTGSRENNTDNNESCTTTNVAPGPDITQADLHIEKSGPATTHPDGTVTYDVVVTNGGDADAENVTVTDLDNDLETFEDLPDGCTDDGTRTTCSLGTIPAHGSRTLTFTAHVDEDAPDGAHIVNCARATTTTGEPTREPALSCVNTVVEEDATPTPTPTEPTPTPTEPPPTPVEPTPTPTEPPPTPVEPTPTPTGPMPAPTEPTPATPDDSAAPGTGPNPPHGGGGPHLPFTGAPLALLAAGALALLGTGIAVRLRARKRPGPGA